MIAIYELIDILLIALALSLDALAVSISCGIKLKKNIHSKFLKISVFFGLFQAIMPLGGYYLSNTFLKNIIRQHSKWFIFTVFFVLSLKTFYDFLKKEEDNNIKASCFCYNNKCLFLLSLATSIDAFILGGVLALKNTSLYISLLIIGIITFINSLIGCVLGNKFQKFNFVKNNARLFAAIILLVLAFKSI